MENKTDVLSRQEFVEKVITIIDSYSNQRQSCTFSIDGKWGCGKSFVLDMISEKLKDEQSEDTADNKYLIIKYNSWKYDYYSEPLIAIVTSILDSIDQSQNIISANTKNKIKKVFSVLSSVALNLANNAMKAKTGVDIKEVINDAGEKYRNTKEDIEKESEYNEYFSFDKELGKLQEALNDITNNCTVILLVDEIDRCLPQYAIQVLERLHHLTEKVDNMITIIATDRKRLDASITSIYGNISTNDYLKKIIDFSVHLDVGELNDQYNEVFKSYSANFGKTFNEEDYQIDEYIKAISSQVDIRTVIRTVEKAKLIHNIVCKEKRSYAVMIVELLLLIAIDYYHAEISSDNTFRDIETIYNLNCIATEGNTIAGKFSDFFNTAAKFLGAELSNVLEGNDSYFRGFDLDETVAYYWIYLNYDKHYVAETNRTKELLFEKNTDELETLKQFYDYLKIID